LINRQNCGRFDAEIVDISLPPYTSNFVLVWPGKRVEARTGLFYFRSVIMISNETRLKWKNKLETIQVANDRGIIELTAWEVEFIDSIDSIINNDGDLSFKQSSCLSKIYEKVV
jgi:hypothetical protein